MKKRHWDGCASAQILFGLWAIVSMAPPGRTQTVGEQTPIVVETAVEAAALDLKRLGSSDTASLLAGVDAAAAGAVSSLPMIHGLGGDRIKSSSTASRSAQPARCT